MLTEHDMTTAATSSCSADIPHPLPTFGKRAQRKLPQQAHDHELPSGVLPRLLTVPEVARCLRKTVKAVHAMNARGQLPGVIRIGRAVLVVEEELVQWLRHKSSAVTTEGAA